MKCGKYIVVALLAAAGVGGCSAPPPGPQKIAPPPPPPKAAPEVSGAGVDDDGRKFTPAPNELLEKVQAELHKIRSLEARFDEVIYTASGKKKQRFEGRLAAKEPNRVIWVVERPLPIAVRVVGEDLRIWTVDVTGKGDMRSINLAGNPTYKSMAEQTRDWAGGNFKKLAESYEVFEEQESPLVLRFEPKPRTGLNGIFTSVSVTLSKGYRSIQKIIYRKTNGENYELTLSSVNVNTTIGPEVWEMPPK